MKTFWSLLTWLAAAYIFIGIPVFGLAIGSHNVLLILLVIGVYIGNLVVLQYAKTRW